MKTKVIKIPYWLVSFVLWVLRNVNDNVISLMCKGYGGDYDYYTGIYWNDGIDPRDYEDYQLWISYKPLTLKS